MGTVISPNTTFTSHGTSIILKANVTDTSPGTKTAPTGTISWKASVPGGIFTSGICTLSPITASTRSCQVTYTTPATTGLDTITATYDGDSTHIKSSVISKLTVT